MNHGEALKLLRTSKHMSQKQLSEGISSQAALSRMEVSGNIPSTTLINYLRRLDVHPTEFFMITEDSDFIDSKEISTNMTQILQSRAEVMRVSKIELDLYRRTNILRHKINAYRLQAVYAFTHEEPLENEVEITSTIKEYLLDSETWFIGDISIYIQVLFLFDEGFIRSQHRKMMKSLTQLPFDKSRQHYANVTYAFNAITLAFLRKNLNDVAFYLEVFKSFLTTDSRWLADSVYYAMFSYLLKLKLNFDQTTYTKLLNEIELFKRFGYEHDYIHNINFVKLILGPIPSIEK